MSFISMAINSIISFLNTLGYLGVGIGMMLESACIPLPSEVVLPLGGIMISTNKAFTIIGMNIAANVGSLLGSLLAYLVGYFGGRPFILKYGKYFFVSHKHFYSAEKTFQKYGIPCVLFGRILPIIRTFISLPAGIAKLNLGKFLLYSLIGMLPWNFVLIWVGYSLGANYEKILGPLFHWFHYIVIAAILIVIAFFVIKSYLKKKADVD